MIYTLFKNHWHINLFTTGLTLLLTLITILMAGVIVFFCFPVIGESLASWMGSSRFAYLIQMLY